MPYLKRIDTGVLLTILRSQVAYYATSLKMGKSIDCRATMKRLQLEIASRGVSVELTDKYLFDFVDEL